MRLSRVQTVFLGENIGGVSSDLLQFSHGYGGGGNSLAPTSSGQVGIGAAQHLLCWDWCWRGFTAFYLSSQLLFRSRHENYKNLSNHLLLQGGREDKRGTPIPQLPISFYSPCLLPLCSLVTEMLSSWLLFPDPNIISAPGIFSLYYYGVLIQLLSIKECLGIVIPALEVWINSGKSPWFFQSNGFLLNTGDLML